MDKEQKSMLYRNIIKFIVGIVLLSISYGYIQNHPAEKVSIISGFSVMYERGQVFVYELFGKDTTVLRQKQKLDQYFQEIVRVAESRGCTSTDLLRKIHETYDSFSQKSLNDLTEYIQYYSMQASEFDIAIQEDCKK